jgi:hypothetical protein
MQVESHVATFNDHSSRVDNVLSTSKLALSLLYMVRNYNKGTTTLKKHVEAAGIYAGGKNTVYCQKANDVLMIRHYKRGFYFQNIIEFYEMC